MLRAILSLKIEQGITMRLTLLTITMIAVLTITSCKNHSTEPTGSSNVPNKGTYVTNTIQGIVYWHNGKDTLLVSGSFLENPSFSPDKRWIAYKQPLDRGYIVKLVKTNGDSLMSLANGRTFHSEYGPLWSPDGTKIVCPDSNAVAVVTISSGTVNYFSANGQMLDGGICSMSGDGFKIAFSALYGRTATSSLDAIYSLDLRTATIDTLVKTQYQICYLSWSANGQRLAFSAYDKANWDVFVYDLSSQQLSRVSNDTEDDIYSAWSPTDPNLLVYSGRPDSTAFPGPRILVLYNASSGSRQALTDVNESPSDYPIWSADGQKILFCGNDTGVDYRRECFYVNIITGEVVPLNISAININW